MRLTVARTIAGFMGLFAWLNQLGELHTRGFDANLWWVDLRGLPGLLGGLILSLAASFWLIFAFCPSMRPWRRRLTLACTLFFLCMVLLNAGQVLWLNWRNVIALNVAVPWSLVVALALLMMVWPIFRSDPTRSGSYHWRLGILVAGVMTMGLPLGLMLFFGQTDYRRPVDVAVVLGCRVYADGRPSDALADRVRTGCELYQQGLVKRLIFSGGPGDGSISEPQGMLKMAVDLGIPPSTILLDEQGVNTQATVRHTQPIIEATSSKRALVVSHDYHLPRVKLAYQRAGVTVYTVPARESYYLTQKPYNMIREIAALWVYWLGPLRNR